MNLSEQECRELLGRNIKRFRNRLGISQLDLALEIEISATFMSDIEMGKKWVSAKTLTELAKALKVDVFELLKPEESVPCAPAGISELAYKCRDEINAIIVQSIEHSLGPTLLAINESLQNLVNLGQSGLG